MFSLESRKYLKNHIEYLTDELEESEDSARQYRASWRAEQDRADELQKELNKAQSVERELRAALVRSATENAKHLAEIVDLKTQNAILRIIAEDLSGKNVDELIEGYKRAVRLLEYGVEVPDAGKEN